MTPVITQSFRSGGLRVLAASRSFGGEYAARPCAAAKPRLLGFAEGRALKLTVWFQAAPS